TVVSLTDDRILRAWQELARDEGVFCEPASAAGLAALAHARLEPGALVVCVVTGHGLKDPETAARLRPPPVAVDADPDAIVAAAAVTGRRTVEELLAEGLPLEGHGDNLAAALAGGVCLTWGARIARIGDDAPAVPIALVPEATMPTTAAREALPTSISHADASFSVGRAALLGAALASRSAELFAEALDDRLHEPYRALGRATLAQVRE